MESGSLGDTMTQNVRRRVSKWDMVENPQLPAETIQNNSKSGDATDRHHDKGLNAGWNSSKSSSGNVPNWLELEGTRTRRSKDASGESCWAPLLKGKSEGKDNIVDRGEKIPPTERTWGGDQSYGASNAPPSDAWRQRSRSRSPKSGWGRPRRSRSRSPHDFKHEGEGWTDRSRSGRGGLAALCREFAAGRCRRGYQCRFLHQNGRDYDRRNFDRCHSENRGRRQEQGGFSRYASDEAFTDSQEHGYEGHNDNERGKHERQRNSRSSALCNDFLKGKCYRGSTCKYVHHGVNPDGYAGWSSRDATRERDQNRREDTFGHDQRREPRRSGNEFCKYFAEGRCRNGDRCRFSHEDPTHGHPEGKSQDTGWGDNLIVGNRSWDVPKWSDNNSGSGIGCPENQSWNSPKWGDNTGNKNTSSNPSYDQPKWGDIDDDKNGYSSSWSSDTNNLIIDDPGKRSWKGPTWSDKVGETNVSNSPKQKSYDDSRRDVPESMGANQFHNVADMASAGVNSENYSQNIGRKESAYNPQDSHTENPEVEGQEQHVLTTLTQPEASKNSYIQQHPGVQADAALFPSEDHHKLSNDTEAHNGTNFFGSNLPVMVHTSGQCSAESTQNQQIFPPASNAQSSNPNEQNQQMVFPQSLQNLNPDRRNQQIVLPSPNVRNLNPSVLNEQMFPQLLSGQNADLNGQSQQTGPLHSSRQIDLNGQSQELTLQLSSASPSQMILDMDESSRKPDLADANIPRLTPGNPVPQNTVPTEKGTQITDLSASLAQLFGNGQQLPQLYATLNHLSATGLVPSAPISAPFVHPNQGSLPEKQYDTVEDSTDSGKPDVSNQAPRFPVEIHAHEQTKFSVPQPIVAPSSVTDGPNEDSLPKMASLEKSNYEDKEMSMDTEAVVVNESATVQGHKEQETGHLKDMDVDDQVDEEGKKSKDAKGMKMFKFALVEFVKELLKPTWKEGHMSREAHKTIVKKVVDKVTGAIQGPHIPQTQEKIDHYLTSSKPKLTKLVHAYVEKYLKI